MDTVGRHTLSKQERLSGKVSVDALVRGGKWKGTGHIKACVLTGTGSGLNRIIVSIPKKNFKRAVKRNLLKRRIRESYRLQKDILTGTGTDILFVYNSTEVIGFKTAFSEIGDLLRSMAR